MALPIVLFVAFALLSAVGTFLATDHFRSRRLAVVLTTAVLAGYVVLALGLLWIIRSWGPS